MSEPMEIFAAELRMERHRSRMQGGRQCCKGPMSPIITVDGMGEIVTDDEIRQYDDDCRLVERHYSQESEGGSDER